ncbi:MAG TPA: hypothetical protein VFA33_28305 [Bryobacteraceae bacterium]|nr:hypothetical protein [Bryobacteraceae bacterium]
MRFAYALLTIGFLSAGWADTLTLKSGQVVNGTYLGGSPRQIRMEVGNQIQSFDVSDAATLQFSGSSGSTAATSAPVTSAPAPQSAPAAQSNVLRPDVQPASAPASGGQGITLPAGTNFVVRLIDSVDSEKNRIGQTFAASMDEPVIVDGNSVIPRGADVVVKLVDDKESGKLTGTTVLTLDLVSVKVNGQVVDVNTQSVSRSSSSRGARTAKLATGGAALGAIIGAIAGGGRGAAIGAGAGAGAGAAGEVVTKGQRVHIPSETRLTFTLETPVRI